MTLKMRASSSGSTNAVSSRAWPEVQRARRLRAGCAISGHLRSDFQGFSFAARTSAFRNARPLLRVCAPLVSYVELIEQAVKVAAADVQFLSRAQFISRVHAQRRAHQFALERAHTLVERARRHVARY